MSDKKNEPQQETTIKPEGEMTICQAAELKMEVDSAIKTKQDISIDLSAVTDFDSAGLQLLMMIKTESQFSQTNMIIVDLSQPVREVIELCNLEQFFADSMNASGSQRVER